MSGKLTELFVVVLFDKLYAGTCITVGSTFPEAILGGLGSGPLGSCQDTR